MALIAVRINTFALNGVPDADGDRFKVVDLIGWTGAPAELATVEKPVGSGAVVAYGRLRARPVVIVGYGIASSVDGAWRLRTKLESATDGLAAADGTLQVDEPTGTKQLTVRLSGDIRVRSRAPRVIEFDIPLLAPNPAKTAV